MLSKALYKMLNRCIVDAEFCRRVLQHPEETLKECELSPADRQLVVSLHASTLAELAAGLQEAGAEHVS
jgi:hypothetical protein